MSNWFGEIFCENGSYTTLNEVYFGKTKALLRLENIIDELRIKYWKDREQLVLDKDFLAKVNQDKLLQDISNQILKTFGMNSIRFSPILANIQNCYVLVTYSKKDTQLSSIPDPGELKDTLILTNSGLKFNNSGDIKTDVMVFITLPLLFGANMTADGLVAILLHEMGHAFSKAFLNAGERKSRANEKFADTVVSMYGYSDSAVKALGQITYRIRNSNSHPDFPLFNVLSKIGDIVGNIWNRLIYDMPHPQIEERFDVMIDQLKYELKNNSQLTERTKREILDQITRNRDAIARLEVENSDIGNKLFRGYSKYVSKYLDRGRLFNSGPDVDEMNSRINRRFRLS